MIRIFSPRLPEIYISNLPNLMLKYAYARAISHLVILETKMKDTYLVYIGQSKEPGEEACLTVGITKNAERRQYLKHMVVQHVLPAKSKRHALAIEREGQIFFDKHYPKAFVRWSPVDLPESPNRGFDWWITSRAVTHYEYLEVFELMRNRQLNWNKSVRLPRRKK